MLDWNLKATWDGAYSAGIETPYGLRIVPGYWRKVQRYYPSGAIRKVEGLGNRLQNGPSDEVCIVGCGFGYLAERFQEVYPGNGVAAVDTSAYVQSRAALTEDADLITMIAGLGLDHSLGEGAALFSALDTGETKALLAINDIDIAAARGVAAVKALFGIQGGRKIDYIVSDDILPTLTDAEAVTLSAAMGDIGRTVVHLVTPGLADGSDKAGGAREDLDYNWHSLSEWRALVGPDRVASIQDFTEAP